jgi:malonyl-CoA O-methyltransferase
MERVRVTVQEGYSRWAATYDAYANPLVVLEEPIVRELVGNVARKLVLDVGCGTGRHTAWLARAGARVVGVEPNPEMAEVARAKCAGLEVELKVGDLARLPVDAGAFDLVVCALVLEHVADLAGAIRELARPLAPGGALVVSVYHPFFLLKGVPPHFASEADRVEYEIPAHVHLPSGYLRALRASGLQVEEMLEPVVDEALVRRLPNMGKHLGHPLAIVFKALARGRLRGED